MTVTAMVMVTAVPTASSSARPFRPITRLTGQADRDDQWMADREADEDVAVHMHTQSRRHTQDKEKKMQWQERTD